MSKSNTTSLLIGNIDVLKSSVPLLTYIVGRLMDAGAPIVLKNKLEVPIREENVEFGNIRITQNVSRNGDLLFEWEDEDED